MSRLVYDCDLSLRAMAIDSGKVELSVSSSDIVVERSNDDQTHPRIYQLIYCIFSVSRPPSLFFSLVHPMSPLKHTGNEKFSQKYCANVAAKLSSVADLPKACTQYKDVVNTLQRRTDSESGTDPFAGMRGAEGARSARASGSEHYAQIQRRYTQSQRFNSKKN